MWQWGVMGVIMAKQPQLEVFLTDLADFGLPAQLERHEMALAGGWQVVKSCPQGQ